METIEEKALRYALKFGRDVVIKDMTAEEVLEVAEKFKTFLQQSSLNPGQHMEYPKGTITGVID